MSKHRKWRVSRRGFLIGAGAAGVGLALGWRYGIPLARLKLAEMIDSPLVMAGPDVPPTAWFEIQPDNSIYLYLPKSEMGQGVHTSLAQIAAEDLEVEWAQIQVVQASTQRGLNSRSGTGGSNSVSSLYLPLREAAATLRQMLLGEASAQLNQPIDNLVTDQGAIYPKNKPAQALTYGQLGLHSAAWEVPEEAPPLKPASEFKYIGQPIARLDLPDKVTGAAIYGYDIRLPGMLYGAVARPATLNGKLQQAKPGSATEQPGVAQVVISDSFVGVAAGSRAQAYAGVQALDITWTEDTSVQQVDLEARVMVGHGKGVIIQQDGNPASVLLQNTTVRSEYRTPLAAHAHLEAQAALADVQPDKVLVWASTQFPMVVRQKIADRLERDVESIEVIPTYLGGGFGRKLGSEATLEAAILSEATGKPVHVGWNRTEDLRYGYFRPPTHHVLRAALGNQGQLEALEHQQASSDVAFPFIPKAMALVMGADFGAWRGGRLFYTNIPNRGATAWHVDLPIRTGWWRGLGLLANTFATESFLDEAAHAAHIDPLQFRLQHLGDDATAQRFKRALQAAADKAGWDTPAPAGRARGIACCIDVGTVVAQVAEVSVAGGQIQVHRVTAAMDPGLVINPDGAAAQSQGAIVMGLSSTLFEAITVKDGQVEAANFDRYPLLTMKETPEIDIVLLESGQAPLGVGEPPIGPIAAAVGNAVFALTGQRLRELPLRLV